MTKPHIKYRVTLTGEERDFLEKLVQKGNTAGYRIRHAHSQGQHILFIMVLFGVIGTIYHA